MNSIVTEDFMACFARLPAEVREQARRIYQIWRAALMTVSMKQAGVKVYSFRGTEFEGYSCRTPVGRQVGDSGETTRHCNGRRR